MGIKLIESCGEREARGLPRTLDPEFLWADVDWKDVRRSVERIQDRIYGAAVKGDNRKVMNLQRLAVTSFHVMLAAIYHVTKESKGRNTPGIDGVVVKTDKERAFLLERVLQLDLISAGTGSGVTYRPSPVKRVFILKPGGGSRPLGIPTILDRVVQCIVKIALEPEYESKFHGNSHGFRPGRSTQDAIEQIRDTIEAGQGWYIIDADLSGCFDNIKHEVILSRIHSFKLIIRKWLECGMIIDGMFKKTGKGTPQGGVISPLLTNIALNDLDYLYNRKIGIKGEGWKVLVTLVRYADDFVILCKSRRVLLGVLKHLKSYVGSIGPALNPGKTRFIHVKQGFKFLGFHVIRHPGRTVWIEPAKSSMKRHVRNLKPLFKIHAQSKSDDLITRLNYGIRGWSNYYRYSRAYIAFGKLDTILARRVLYWCGRRHPKKNKAWIKKKYFAGDSWTLHGENLHLARYYQTRRSRYRWRVGSRSFLDPRAREAWKQPFIDPTSSFLHMIDALS